MKVAILLASSSPGNTLKQFIQIRQVCKTIFTEVDFLTRQGQLPIFDGEAPTDLEVLDYCKIDLLKHDYQGLVVPDGEGHYNDYSEELHNFIYSFVKFKSMIGLIRTHMSDWNRMCCFDGDKSARQNKRMDVSELFHDWGNQC